MMYKDEFKKQHLEIIDKILKILPQGNYPKLKKIISISPKALLVMAHVAMLSMKKNNLTLEQELQRQEEKRNAQAEDGRVN